MSPGWDYAANRAAVNFIRRCKPSEARRLLAVLERLVDNPAMRIDGSFRDESGRKISIVQMSGFRIHFLVDHFAKEVRVLDIGRG